MNAKSEKYKIRLGLFVTAGLAIFIAAIFIIGRQKNLFNPVFKISALFKNVSGLQVGNNIRFSGINVGTVEDIRIVNDSTVRVNMIIEKDVHKFIKSDCRVSIGSDGIIGDRVVTINQSGTSNSIVTEGQLLEAVEPIEMDDIIGSLKVTGENAEVFSGQLAEILYKINQGNGTLGRLIQDTSIAENIDATIINLRKSSKGLNENMEAAKSNILLRGFFKKKEREKEAAKKKNDEEAKDQQKEDKEN